MATTTTAFPSLSVPAEDTMEIGSPANQAHDGDIDLDFGDGDYDGGVMIQEDEQMLTDGEQTRPVTAEDDMMEDDVHLTEPAVHEADMQDTLHVEQIPEQQDDEELIDYDDEVFDHQQTEDTTLANQTENAGNLQYQAGEDEEVVDEEIAREPEKASADQTALLETVDFAGYQQEFGDAEHAYDATADGSHIGTGDTAQEQHDAPAEEVHVHSNEADVAEFAAAAEAGEAPNEAELVDAASEQPALSVNTSVYPAHIDAPGTPTDTGLHPMTLYYGEYFMPLFKSKRQLDGLLKDDNLASLSLHELLRNCRQRLGVKISNVLPEEQELTLAFDRMGLMLVENSRAAFEHSLNDVLDVYLQLHQNDGTEDIPPLSLLLTHQQFSNQLSVLKQAAEVGRGMSDFVSRSEEDEQDQDQEHGEEYGQEAYGEEDSDAAVHQQQLDQQQDHYDEQNLGDTRTAEPATGQFTEQGNDVEDHYQGEEYTGKEYTEDEQYEEEQTEETFTEDHQAPVDQPESHHAGEGTTTTELAAQAGQGGATSAFEEHATERDQLVDTGEPPALAEGTEGADQEAASTASSETVQGDQTTDSAELPAEGQEGSSTIPAKYEAVDPTAIQEFDDEHTTGEQDAGDEAQHVTHEQGALDASAEQYAAGDGQAPYLGSEDFLNDFDEEQHDPDPATIAQQYEDYQEEAAGDYENHDDQADTFDEQQNADKEQPGEDEEQFHTAHDILDGESYEHGLEHQPNGDDYTGEEHSGGEPEPQDETGQGEEVIDLEDDIGFDDDTTEQHEARKVSSGDIKATVPGSPLGKRSFEEHADDDFELNEPDAKKARSD